MAVPRTMRWPRSAMATLRRSVLSSARASRALSAAAATRPAPRAACAWRAASSPARSEKSVPALQEAALGRKLQQLRRIAAQDHVALSRWQFSEFLDGAHRIAECHVGRIIGAAKDAVDADLANEIEQDIVAVRDGVVVKAAQIVRR